MSFAAADMRGFGASVGPSAIERYSILDNVGDMVALVAALGEKQAVIVGHDWGAPVAWHAALLRPDIFHAVACLSIPYQPPGEMALTERMRRAGVAGFYQLYFQQEGVAEEELERDVEASLRKFYWSLGGEAQAIRPYKAVVPKDGGLLDTCLDCADDLPQWMSRADLDMFVAAYRQSGFRGGLNWYRNIDRNAQLLLPWRGCGIGVPALFVGGESDPATAAPAARAIIANQRTHIPKLTKSVMLEGCGHWTQQERPREVNKLLTEFLWALELD